MSVRICFVGLENLPVLAPEFAQHRVGGAQLQQTLLAKALVRRGMAVSMVVGDYGQEDGAVWNGIRTYKAYSAHEGIPVVRFLHPRWTKLCAAMRRAAADVYYVSTAGGQVGQVAIWAANNGRRMIFRVASDADCDPRRVLISFWRDKKLYEYGLHRAAVILAQSARQQLLLRQNYGVESAVASSLVDDAPDQVRAFSERDVSLLWVGNIQQLKRPDMFLELAQRLPGCFASMVGGPLPDTQQLYRQVSESAARVGSLTFHGPLSYPATNQLFDRARLFVNTSEIEGFPNTFLQAWIRGVPVVSFFDPDGVIQREGLGQAVASLDEMVCAAERLTGDVNAWLEVSMRCRAYIARRYGESQLLAPYLAAVEQAARGASG